MREIFLVLEQQRVSRDAIENLGSPSEEKFNKKMDRERQAKQVNLAPQQKKKQEPKPKK